MFVFSKAHRTGQDSAQRGVATFSPQEEEVATECGVVASVVIELVACRQPQVDYISHLQLQGEGVSHELKAGVMGHLRVDHDLVAVLRHFNSH